MAAFYFFLLLSFGSITSRFTTTKTTASGKGWVTKTTASGKGWFTKTTTEKQDEKSSDGSMNINDIPDINSTSTSVGTPKDNAVNLNSVVATEYGYGCLPVTNCEVKEVTSGNGKCNDGQFLVIRHGDDLLCCALRDGWETDKEHFDWHAVLAASKEEGAGGKEPRNYIASLAGGDNENEGNVMINGRPVCDDYWNDEAATVVCRMLGYLRGEATSYSEFGNVKDDFILDDVRCTGVEQDLTDCKHLYNDDNCGGGEGAGARCFGPADNVVHEVLSVDGTTWLLLDENVMECPRYWVKAGSHCYHMSDNSMNWEQAKRYCEQRSGYLAEIRDSSEQNHVRGFSEGQGPWIGLNDKAREGHYVWDHSGIGGHMYSNWNNGEPNNWGSGEDCVHLIHNGKWNDLSCTFLKRALCQSTVKIIRWDHDESYLFN